MNFLILLALLGLSGHGIFVHSYDCHLQEAVLNQQRQSILDQRQELASQVQWLEQYCHLSLPGVGVIHPVPPPTCSSTNININVNMCPYFTN